MASGDKLSVFKRLMYLVSISSPKELISSLLALKFTSFIDKLLTLLINSTSKGLTI